VTGSFQKSSVEWQLRLVQQRLGEWLERLFAAGDRAHRPNWALPEWLLRLLFWLIAGALIVWLSWQLYTLLRPYFDAAIRTQSRPSDNQSQIERPVTVATWLQRSRTFAQRGDYREACRALYMAALQRLNDSDPIPYEPSRTDGEYLQIVQTLPRPTPYQVLIRTHEQICFTEAEVSAAEFDRCQQAYQDIE